MHYWSLRCPASVDIRAAAALSVPPARWWTELRFPAAKRISLPRRNAGGSWTHTTSYADGIIFCFSLATAAKAWSLIFFSIHSRRAEYVVPYPNVFFTPNCLILNYSVALPYPMWSVHNKAGDVLRLCFWSFRSVTSLNLKFVNNFKHIYTASHVLPSAQDMFLLILWTEIDRCLPSVLSRGERVSSAL